MIIGVPKEIKNHEYRVGMIPSSVRELVSHGHQVLIETNAGHGIGISDNDYIASGASILPTAADIFAKAEMIVKVKEPQAVERALLKEGQILFTYLHLAPDFPQTEELIKSKAVCIAYETVTDNMGRLPLLAPMSEVAGRMSIQAGAQALEKSRGGCGLLLSGVPGVAPAKVVVLGGGVVGANAARMAVGLRADVTIIDKNIDTLRKLSANRGQNLTPEAMQLFGKAIALDRENPRAVLLMAQMELGMAQFFGSGPEKACGMARMGSDLLQKEKGKINESYILPTWGERMASQFEKVCQ